MFDNHLCPISIKKDNYIFIFTISLFINNFRKQKYAIPCHLETGLRGKFQKSVNESTFPTTVDRFWKFTPNFKVNISHNDLRTKI